MTTTTVTPPDGLEEGWIEAEFHSTYGGSAHRLTVEVVDDEDGRYVMVWHGHLPDSPRAEGIHLEQDSALCLIEALSKVVAA